MWIFKESFDYIRIIIEKQSLLSFCLGSTSLLSPVALIGVVCLLFLGTILATKHSPALSQTTMVKLIQQSCSLTPSAKRSWDGENVLPQN